MKLDSSAALVNFVCPDSLGSQTSFKTVFSGPISRSQDKNATAEEVELGKERSRELNRRVDSFVLRRTSATIAKFLPPLTKYVVFCKPSALQVPPQLILRRGEKYAVAEPDQNLSLSVCFCLPAIKTFSLLIRITRPEFNVT